MKRLSLFATLVFVLNACGDKNSEVATQNEDTTCGSSISPAPTVVIDADFPGDVYLNGRFTGQQTPATVTRWSGIQTVGIGGGVNGYLRDEIDPGTSCTIHLSEDALIEPRIWRARYINLLNVVAQLEDGSECAVRLNSADADRSYESFTKSLENFFGPYSHSTVSWEVERVDITEEVVIPNQGWGYYPQGADIEPYIQDIAPGELDLILTFYRSKSSESECVIPGPFFGLATAPTPASREAGFIVVKLETE
ncbi:hypothetical protein KAI87_06100, partial [Myxococcota bacterium]|nr:hypothetical protein [Myxococcota bacterium]